MTNISGNLGLGRSNIEQALRTMRERAAQMQGQNPTDAPVKSFDNALTQSVQSIDQSVKASENLHIEALSGNLDFHEVATRVKEAQLRFDFSMQVRNKFIDAYREVMRMTV